MNLKQAQKKIEELEQRIRVLETRPAQQIHYHYQTPYYPWWQYQPQTPWVHAPSVWMGGAGATGTTITTSTSKGSDVIEWSNPNH